MDPTPSLLQLDPETFRVVVDDGVPRTCRLAHHTRRGLGLTGIPPLTVATELVRFLVEHGAVPADTHFDLGAAAGRVPGFVDEIAARFA